MEKEIWKAAKNFEGLYEVSTLGKVRSIQFHGKQRIKELKQFSGKCNYKFVKLRIWKNGYAKCYPVHRLVAETFLPNPDNKPQVDHIDTNPANNKLSNLRWVTNLENQRNPITLERLRKALTAYNKSSAHAEDMERCRGKLVSKYDLSGNYIASYKTLALAAKSINATAAMVKRVCDGTRIQTKGYIFKYGNYYSDKGEDEMSS